MEDFEEYSNIIQNIHFEFLEGKEYDVLKFIDLHHFSSILHNYIPSKVKAKELAKKITHSGNLYYRIIVVNCYANDVSFSVPVIRIKQNENQDVFYDIECRKYENWEDFLSCNRFPPCLMIFPENGTYKKEDGKLKLEKRNSPACSKLKVIHQGIYVVAKVVAVLASFGPDFKCLQPYNKAIAFISGVCNGYTASHHCYQLYDHKKHGHSIHYSDEVAAGHWINIGKDLLLFGVTAGKMKWGSPYSEEIAFQNLLLMCKQSMNDDILSSMKNIQNSLLTVHMCYFTDQAVEFFQENILFGKCDAKELIFNIRRYVLYSDLVKSKYRQFLKVDAATLSTVAGDMAFAREIPILFQMDLYTINIDLNKVVDKIMQEVKNWANGKSSVMQLMFRVSGMCTGLERYETLEEMCKHFNVSQPVDIQVNDKYLFKGSRKEFLELYNVFDVEKFPQLLLYAVEYLSNSVNDDLKEFKKHFNERVANEMSMPVSPQFISAEKEWVNALTLENISYVHSVPYEGTNLVKPKAVNGTEITLCDLYKLAKRLLGRVGDIDMRLVRPDVDWVIVASKRSRFAVIVAPKITLENSGSLGGCYPVFKRPF